jgi:uncharacterized protein YjgD (DUF1641 family)
MKKILDKNNKIMFELETVTKFPTGRDIISRIIKYMRIMLEILGLTKIDLIRYLLRPPSTKTKRNKPRKLIF